MINAGESEDDRMPHRATKYDPYTPLQQAARLLFTMSDESAIPFWKAATGNSDEIVALWAHAALWKLKQNPDENLKRIDAILRDTDKFSLRLAGLDVIKTLNDKQYIPTLRQYLQKENPAADRSIDPMPRILSSSGHSEDRQEAFKIFADLGGKDVLDDIKKNFREDPDGYVRRDAADRLITLTGNEASHLLLPGLEDRSPGVRYHVCELLGITGEKDVVNALKKVAEADPYKDDKGEYPVRNEANRTLKKIEMLGSNGVDDRLIREARNKDSELRFWAIERLGEIRDKPAVIDTLKELLKDPSPACECGSYHVRESAAESLRKLGKQVTKKEKGVFDLQE